MNDHIKTIISAYDHALFGASLAGMHDTAALREVIDDVLTRMLLIRFKMETAEAVQAIEASI